MEPSDNASDAVLPPAGLPAIIQLELGALSTLVRFLVHVWTGVPELAWIGLCAAAVIGVLYVNGRCFGVASFTGLSVHADARGRARPGDEPPATRDAPETRSFRLVVGPSAR